MDLDNASAGSLRFCRVRLHGAANELSTKRQLEEVLGSIAPCGLGRSERNWLIVKRLAPSIQLSLDRSGVDNKFKQAVREEIDRCIQSAKRPWSQMDAAETQAVLFADETELAACLIRDWVRGMSAECWWARTVLGDMSTPEWWRRELLPRGDLVPAVLSLLADQGAAAAWLARLSESELAIATGAVGSAHGLSAVATEQRAQGLAEKAQLWPAGEGLSAPTEAEERLTELTPEIWQVTGSPPRVRLLAVALGLRRDPAWVRGTGFAQALRRLESGTLAWARSTGGSDDSGPISEKSPAWSHLGATRRPRVQGFGWTPLRQGDSTGSSLTVAAALPEGRGIPAKPNPSIPSRDLSSSGGDANERQRGSSMDRPIPRRQSKPALQSALGGAEVPSSAGKQALGELPAPQHEESLRSRKSGADGQSSERNAAAGSQIAGADYGEAVAAGEARIPFPDEPPISALGQLRSGHRIETAFGGIFYLLNLGLALDLYGDFTQPRRPGIDLSPWDWLALIGRSWFGRGFQRDPVWELLGQLAVRPPEKPPGGAFSPPDHWSVPPDWLRPWDSAGPLHIQVRGNRLRLWHPAGFLLADQPRVPGKGVIEQARTLCSAWPDLKQAPLVRLCRRAPCSGKFRVRDGSALRAVGATPALIRWMRRLLPYLEARLQLALGSTDRADVPGLVCRHPARIHVSSTALDLELSLAGLPIELRIAGLDRDPGWIPAADRSVAFHFK